MASGFAWASALYCCFRVSWLDFTLEEFLPESSNRTKSLTANNNNNANKFNINFQQGLSSWLTNLYIFYKVYFK